MGLSSSLPEPPTLTLTPQVIVAERGPLVWVFNFSPFNTYEGLQVRLWKLCKAAPWERR